MGTSSLKLLFNRLIDSRDFFPMCTMAGGSLDRTCKSRDLNGGVICSYQVEEIENKPTQQVSYMDKLVDELAKDRKMEKILRVAQRD